MRWEDERYVRLYTRDTLTWKRLGWEGRAVLPQLMRKVDRAGVVEIDEGDPGEALALLLDMPEEVTKAAWPRMIATGTVTLRDEPSRAIILPNFIEAQEAKASDIARARKHRELARIVKSVTPCDSGVTPRDGSVTRGHTASQSVTPSLAVPSLATPSEPTDGGKPEKAPASPPAEPLTLIPPKPLSPLLSYLAAEFPQAKADHEWEEAQKEAYPGIDLLAESKAARAWELSNPKLIKTHKRRFLGNWFAKAQNDLRRPAQSRPGAATLQITPDARAEHAIPGRKFL